MGCGLMGGMGGRGCIIIILTHHGLWPHGWHGRSRLHHYHTHPSWVVASWVAWAVAAASLSYSPIMGCGLMGGMGGRGCIIIILTHHGLWPHGWHGRSRLHHHHTHPSWVVASWVAWA